MLKYPSSLSPYLQSDIVIQHHVWTSNLAAVCFLNNQGCPIQIYNIKDNIFKYEGT